jgi:hypothetical protein
MTRRLACALSLGATLLLPALVFADAAAEADLDRAINAHDGAGAKKALAAATSSGDAKAAAVILKEALRMRDLDAHKELLEAIRGVKADDAIAKLADQARHAPQADLRYILVEGLALQGSPVAAKAVFDGLDDKDDSVQTVAARSSRLVGTPESVEKLIARLEKAEKNPREASLCRELNGALSALTNESLSFALEWKGWWMSHKDGWKPGGAPTVNPPAGSPQPQGGDKPPEKGNSGSGDEPRGGGGDTVVRRMAKDRPADAHTIEKMAQDDVICVKGASDKVEDVLTAIGVKHTFVQKDKFDDFKLDPKSILVINCDGKGHPLFDDLGITKIREFVEHGGFLFTSDWELQHTIEKAFPQSIAKGGESGKDDFKVGIKPVDGKNPFLRDVFPMTTWDSSALSWKMDGRSFLIKIISPDVSTLIESPELKQKFPEYPAVAVSFWWKDGHVVRAPKPQEQKDAAGHTKSGGKGGSGGCVLHVLSHFKHQKDKDAGDKFALQQLLMNFFLEKQAYNKLSK